MNLIYPNEFGGGHLTRDKKVCLNYLRREYASVEKDPTATLYDDIGNGIVRAKLAAVKPEDLEQLGRDFISSAAEHTGTMDSFLKKPDILRQLTEEGIFSFGMQELRIYLSEYIHSGCPMVSHSEQYRQAYQPAYRIVSILIHKKQEQTADA